MATAENVEKTGKAFVRESNDRYREVSKSDSNSGAIYFRSEHDLWFKVDPYSVRTAILSDDAVRTQRMHAAHSIHELAVSEGRKPPEYNLNEAVEPEDRLDIRISAALTTDGIRGMGFITEDGLRPFSGDLRLELHIGPSACSAVRHYNPTDHSAEEVTFVSVWIPRQQMEWLHRELLARPKALFTMSVDAKVFKRSVERWYGQPFYIEPDSIAPITNVSFYATDRENSAPDVQKAISAVQAGNKSDFDPKLLKLAYWMISLLALILLTLLIKR